ncbi:MAG: YezD family protein [Planctomycetia bacterium]
MSQTNRHPVDRPEPAQAAGAALRRIGDALQGLRYGSVLAIVQDGVVVQIERTEKTRLDKSDR